MAQKKLSRSQSKQQKRQKTEWWAEAANIRFEKNLPMLLPQKMQSKLRSLAVQRMKRAYKSRNSIQEAIQYFEQKDLPAYEKWFDEKYVSYLDETRELAGQFQNKLRLLMLTELEQAIHGLSFGEAWERVNAAGYQSSISKPEEVNFGLGKDLEDQDLCDCPYCSLMREEGLAGDTRFEAAFKDDDEFLEFMRRGFEEARNSRDPSNKDTRIHAATLKRVRELYRRLVKRLHPDHGGETSPQHLELWHLAQEGYRNSNFETLTLVFVMLVWEDREALEAITIGEMSAAADGLHHQNRLRRRELNRYNRHPACGFDALSTQQQKQLERRYRREMAEERREIADKLRELNFRLSAFLEQDRRQRGNA